MKKTLKFLIGMLVVVFATLALVGCKPDNTTTGGGNGGNVTPTPNPVSVVGVTDTEVKVGNTVALSGGLAFIGLPFQAGINAVFDTVNKAGGVHGRQIKLVNKDDGGNSTTGTQFTEQLLDECFGIVGSFASTTEPSVDLVADHNSILFYAANSTAALYKEKAEGGYKGVFPVQPVSTGEGKFLFARAAYSKVYGDPQSLTALPADGKIGIVYSTGNATEIEVLDGIKKEAKARKFEQARLIEASVDVKNPTSVNAAIADLVDTKKVNSIIVLGNLLTFQPVATAINAKSFAGPVFASYFNAELKTFEKLTNFTGKYYVNAWVDAENAPKAENDEYAKIVTDTNNDQYKGNAYFIAGYIAGKMFVEALERTGKDLTVEKFIAAQEKANVLNIPLGGTLTVGEGRRVATEELSLLEYVPKNGNKPAQFKQFAPLTKLADIK